MNTSTTTFTRSPRRRLDAQPTPEVLRRSPTQPPLADADAPPLGSTVGFVALLLSASGLIAWLAAPFLA